MKIKSAKLFRDDKKIELINTKEGTIVKLPAKDPNEHDLIIELTI